MLKVIAGIDNDREVFRRKDLGESVSELRATDTASQGNDFHLPIRLMRQRCGATTRNATFMSLLLHTEFSGNIRKFPIFPLFDQGCFYRMIQNNVTLQADS